LGVTGDSGDVLVKGNSTILLAADGAADSSAALRRAVTLPVKVVVRALAAYSPAAVAIWTKACATPFPTNAKRRSPPWTSASRPDACLDTWDGCGTAAGDILDAAGNLPACDKFGLSVTSILSVFTKFRV
jgi:hypothetical protein